MVPKTYLTWLSQRQEHVRQVWGRSDVSLRELQRFKVSEIEFTKNISDLVSQRSYPPRTCVAKFGVDRTFP